MIYAVTVQLKALATDLVDGEGNRVRLDAAYVLRGDDDIAATVSAIRQKHGSETLLLPLSARSGGGGIFQVTPPDGLSVVGLSVEPANDPMVSVANDTALESLALDRIVICPGRREILAGAGITLAQLNHALDEQLGSGYRVLGADLTSYTYAQAGATYMTGGMGPQRRYFSDSVVEARLFDGRMIRRLAGQAVVDHAGTYGWTGLVTALRCRYVAVPAHEIAFALPVDSTPESLARLLAHLSPWCFLSERGNTLVNAEGGSDLLMGIEHVTVDAMAPMLADGADNPVNRRARALAEKCRAARCDGLVFINGYTHTDRDEFLMRLLDDPAAESMGIAGIDLAHSEWFNDPETMRAVREGIPAAARTQAPVGRYVFKGHTDATIRLDPETVSEDMQVLWRINREYVDSLADHFSRISGVSGQVLVYGHMNPWGVDPHNRLTFACDERAAFDQAVSFNQLCLSRYYRALDGLCRGGRAQFIGGEKGAGSEREILSSFSGSAPPPDGLSGKFERQRRVVRDASPCFRWRALPPYGDGA